MQSWASGSPASPRSKLGSRGSSCGPCAARGCACTFARHHPRRPAQTYSERIERATARDELLTVETVGGYLESRGIAPVTEAAELGGGVSNVVLAVRSDGRDLVVKQSLPRLRVAQEWHAKRERVLTEARALTLAAELTPAHVPAVVDVDPVRYAVVIERAPRSWSPWKDRLLAGEANPSIGGGLGEVLAAWHASTSGDDRMREAFGDHEAFDQLRVDPFYRTVARRWPDLAPAIARYVDAMLSRRTCLVHGDYSPKNVLVGDGLWVVDFEVAHAGDPSFDIAFMLTHLFLKSIHRPGEAGAYLACAGAFVDAYREGAGPLDLRYVLGHVGCLALARVDGKSPVEYLDGRGRERARAAGRELLAQTPRSLDEAWHVALAPS